MTHMTHTHTQALLKMNKQWQSNTLTMPLQLNASHDLNDMILLPGECAVFSHHGEAVLACYCLSGFDVQAQLCSGLLA